MNQLYYGDNFEVLREHIAKESVDLIYLDPPFNSKRDHNLLFKSPKGVTSEAQIEAFEDTCIGTSRRSASSTSCCIRRTRA